MSLLVRPGIEIPDADLAVAFVRSSGPGGQNVNKVNTKTELRLNMTALHGLNDRALGRLRSIAGRKLLPDGDLLLTADTERTQEANRRACLAKLRELIEKAQVEPKIRKKSKPSRASKLRRVEGKRKNSEKKKDRGWRES